MDSHRATTRPSAVETESPAHPPLNRASAEAVRELLGCLARPHGGVPWREIVRLCADLGGEPLEFDLFSARAIGTPVVVLRDRAAAKRQPVFDKLSPRERDVARLLVAGHENAEIARVLGISIGTVKDHVHHALKKTGMASRTELAAALAREGV